jgi:actin-related protein
MNVKHANTSEKFIPFLDEVGALVIDMGSHTTRAGYAGEDMPKADFPSYAGVVEEYVEKTESMDTGTANEIIRPSLKNKRYLIESMSLKTPKPNVEIRPFLKDGLIDDWNLYENVLNYVIGKHLKCDASKHPILLTEPVVRHSECAHFVHAFIKINIFFVYKDKH